MCRSRRSAQRLTGLSRVGARTADRRWRRGTTAASPPTGSAKIKKDLIERECQGLLDFVESPFTLDDVAGIDAVKSWLREDASCSSRGALHALPMGYLDRRPHRHRQDVPGAVLGRRARHPVRRLQELPRPVGRRHRIEPGEDLRRPARYRTGASSSSTKPIRPPASARAATATAASPAASTRCSPRRCPTRATAAGSSGSSRRRGPDLLEVDLKRQGRLDVHIPLFPPETRRRARGAAARHRAKLKFPLDRRRSAGARSMRTAWAATSSKACSCERCGS